MQVTAVQVVPVSRYPSAQAVQISGKNWLQLVQWVGHGLQVRTVAFR